jgi:Flp pilus assembly protein TadG
MSSSNLFLPRLRAKLARSVRRFRQDCRGSTAVEFGLIAVPFFALVLAMMTIGSHYLAYHSLERGVLEASRLLRTGEAQKAGMDLDDFRELVCNSAGTFISCDERLVVHIRSSQTFAGLAPATSCVTDGALTPSAGSGSDAVSTQSGEDSIAVQVTACYEWEMGAVLWQMLWNLISPTPRVQGKTILSATTAFRSEPYQ